MQLLLFECSGPPEDPKQVARGGYKICTSAVLHEDTPVETVHEALIDLAKQLEQVSRDSFVPGNIFDVSGKVLIAYKKYMMQIIMK